MRSSKFYLIILLLLTYSSCFAYELTSKVKCYKSYGQIVQEKEATFLYINYSASSQKSFKISNPKELLKKHKYVKSFKANATFKVNEDCDFQCNITLLSNDILPPWEKFKPVKSIELCD